MSNGCVVNFHKENLGVKCRQTCACVQDPYDYKLKKLSFLSNVKTVMLLASLVTPMLFSARPRKTSCFALKFSNCFGLLFPPVARPLASQPLHFPGSHIFLLTLPRLLRSLRQWSRNSRAFYQATSSKPIFEDVLSFL